MIQHNKFNHYSLSDIYDLKVLQDRIRDAIQEMKKDRMSDFTLDLIAPTQESYGGGMMAGGFMVPKGPDQLKTISRFFGVKFNKRNQDPWKIVDEICNEFTLELRKHINIPEDVQVWFGKTSLGDYGLNVRLMTV